MSFPIVRIQPAFSSIERLERLIAELCEPHVTKAGVFLDRRKLSFTKPSGLVPIVAKFLHMKQMDGSPGVIHFAPPEERQCANYLSQIGFLSFSE